MLATVFSGGLSTFEISKENVLNMEVSQVFIAIDLSQLCKINLLSRAVVEISSMIITQSVPIDESKKVTYPG
jgi:LDH2 family malate/lactate/ureidoglycolate dehydrogenase